MTPTADGGSIFRLVTIPARWVGRYRPDLMATIRTDAATYQESKATLFVLLVIVAIGYTLLAQTVHAFGTWGRLPGDIDMLYQPFFYLVYSESLPYMIMVAAVGTFSPAIGVLLIAVFIPTDLAATAVGNYAPMPLTPLPQAIAARLITYAVLWVLAVEIPIIVRRFDGLRSGASRLRSVVVRAGGTALLTTLWAALVPWLVQPAMAWTALPQTLGEVTMPLWLFFYAVGLAAGALAGVAAAVVWSPAAPEAGAATAHVPTGTASLRRDLISVVVLAVLFGGFYGDVTQAILIIGTLILTLPVLSAVLPRIPAPVSLRRRSLMSRFVAAVILTGLIGWGVTTFLSGMPDMQTPLAGPIIIAITAPVFRIILELGREAPATGASPPSGPSVVTTTLSLLMLGLLWLAVPGLALAGNCPPEHPVADCAGKSVGALPLLGAGAAAAAAAGAGAARSAKGAELMRDFIAYDTARILGGKDIRPPGWMNPKSEK